MALATPPTKYTYTRPWMAPYQREAIFCPERYAVVDASTKSGKTVGCMAWLVEQALEFGGPSKHFWWAAPTYKQAAIAYERTKNGLPAGLYTKNDTGLTLTLFTGATLEYRSAEKPDNLYGEDVYAVVIDEASRCREEAWWALRSTMTATRGPIRIIGNVKGKKNWAFHLGQKAAAGEPGWHYARITAHDAVAAGILDAAEVEDAKRQLPAAVFQELYEAEPSDDAGNPFGLAAIRACLGPLSDQSPAHWGVDLAKSQDWTVAVALDAAGRVCRFERFQRPWEETYSTILGAVGTTPAFVDSTGVGDPIVERLQRSGPSAYTGYHFTAPSKQRLMEGLAVAIQQREITFPDGVLRHELDSYEYEYTRTGVRYTAPEGLHDDAVCALALAVECRRTARGVPHFY